MCGGIEKLGDGASQDFSSGKRRAPFELNLALAKPSPRKSKADPEVVCKRIAALRRLRGDCVYVESTVTPSY